MKIDRRKFLELMLFLGFSTSFGLSKDKEKERVVLVRDSELFYKENKIAKDVLEKMLEKGICLLEGENEIEVALKKYFKKDEIIGIKSNEWGPLPTPKEVEDILLNFLLKIGVKEENIEIADRKVLKSKVFQNCTSLINVRPLRTHHWAGVGSLIKNYIMFVKKPWDYHSDFCSNLGSIWHFPQIKGKTKLNILIMFTPLFYGVGAHHFDERYTWKYCGILFGKKPVPVDSVGLKILKEKRKKYFGKEIPFQPPPIHISIADKIYNLGTSNLNEIEIIKTNKMPDDFI